MKGCRTQHFVAIVDKGIDEQMNGFIGAVGQSQLVNADAKMARQIFERVFVFGIDAEIGCGEIALDEIDDMRRRADGVLIEIEPQLIAARRRWADEYGAMSQHGAPGRQSCRAFRRCL